MAKNQVEPPAVARPTVSDVPLRIRIVGQVKAPEIIERRWLSGSEQPIEIQPQSIDDFLANSRCEADVVLFPARLLGELIARDWISKLPKLEVAQPADPDLAESRTFPPAWLSQCSYGGVAYAIPLGCSVTGFVASESFAATLPSDTSDRDPVVPLQTIFDQLHALEQTTAPGLLPDAVDRTALVDRFLALAFAYTERKKQYGVLLDLESMQPRLTEPEFQKAAETLVRLAAQPNGGAAAAVGSHSDAWSWATSNVQPSVAIATTNQLNEDAAKISTGAMLQISQEMMINSGGGLIAAIAVDCRQSQQSNRFLKWLTESQTSAVLAPLVLGIDSPSPANFEALAWRIQQVNAQVALNDQLPQELRIPATHELRSKLAVELLAMLKGSKTPPQALADAQREWDAIIAPQRDVVKRQYQQSLGLKDANAS